MKTLLSLLLFLPTIAFADVSVPRALQYLEATYDVASAGGASTSHNLGALLPAGAIIQSVWVYINTPFTVATGGNESLAFQCSGTNDLMDFNKMSTLAADRVLYARVGSNTSSASGPIIGTGAGGTVLNLSQGYGSVQSACAVTAVVRSSGIINPVPYTGGNANIVVEYFKKP